MAQRTRTYRLAALLSVAALLAMNQTVMAQSAVDRLEASRMCVERVETARKNGIVKWFRDQLRAGIEPSPLSETQINDPKCIWSVRGHFNGQQLRCFMAISIQLKETSEEEFVFENIWDAFDLNGAVATNLVYGSGPTSRFEFYWLYGKGTDKKTYSALMTR